MKKVMLIVIDALGVGALPDAPLYNDSLECNTLAHVVENNNGIQLPYLEKLGLLNVTDIQGYTKFDSPLGLYGKMQEISVGKDTTTGHWEMAGILIEDPFRVYPDGFPNDIITEFIANTGCQNILGNKPASGTAIIQELGEQHQKTGYPIVYTSADSVFQIACHVDTVPLETLYQWCESAREILNGERNVSRVIARPFAGKAGSYNRIGSARHDYSVPPPTKSVLDCAKEQGVAVVAVGKIKDIFLGYGITHHIKTGNNTDGLSRLLESAKGLMHLKNYVLNGWNNQSKGEFVFANLVDTDMLYGHRRDYIGYGKALEEIDQTIGEIVEALGNDDLLLITGDHGCDPTMPGSDHTREYAPLIAYNKKLHGRNIGIRSSFSDIAATVADWLDLEYNGPGFLSYEIFRHRDDSENSSVSSRCHACCQDCRSL